MCCITKRKMRDQITEQVNITSEGTYYGYMLMVLREGRIQAVSNIGVLPGDFVVFGYWARETDLVHAVTTERAVEALWPMLEKLLS